MIRFGECQFIRPHGGQGDNDGVHGGENPGVPVEPGREGGGQDQDVMKLENQSNQRAKPTYSN